MHWTSRGRFDVARIRRAGAVVVEDVLPRTRLLVYVHGRRTCEMFVPRPDIDFWSQLAANVVASQTDGAVIVSALKQTWRSGKKTANRKERRIVVARTLKSLEGGKR